MTTCLSDDPNALLSQITAGLRAVQDNTTGLLRDVADHTLALVDDLAICLARGALRREPKSEESAV